MTDTAARMDERQLGALFMAMPVPTYSWRAHGDDFLLVGCNRAAIDITGGRIHDWIGARASEMFADRPGKYCEAMRSCLVAGEPVTKVLRHRLVTTGEERDFVVTFAPVPPDHVLVHTVDETDRRAAERALRESEERHRALTENAMDLVAVLDADGRFTYVSPSYTMMLGYPAGSLDGTDAMAIVHPGDLPAAAGVLAALLGDASESQNLVARLRAFGGEYRTIEFTGRNLLGHPAVRGIVCNGRDVTEREAAQVELRALEAQLRQAQKLEAVGALAGGIAHDFNNILTVIRANAEFARGQLDESSPAAHDVREIIAAVTRATELTRQLLAFSRRQVLSPVPLDLNDVVRGMQRMLQRLIVEDIRLETDLSIDLGVVLADRGQVEQVIMNLAVNAHDAMSHGGTLTIATFNAQFSESIRLLHDDMPPGSYVALAVRDTGRGMEPHVIEQIFEPFFTTKELGRGTGLGLSTVFGIVRQSGGYIRVESELDVGSVFTVYLPRQDASRTPPSR